MNVEELIERLRTIKLLSQRNQLALQDEAAEALSRQKAAGAAMARELADAIDILRADDWWAHVQSAEAALTAWNSVEQGDGG